MSYQSIKRVLGETSLERKCRFLFGGCLFLLISASFLWYGMKTDEIVNKENRNTGRLLTSQALYVQHWKEMDNKSFSPDLMKEFSEQPYKVRFILPNPPQDKLTTENFNPRNPYERNLLKKYLRSKPPKSASPEDVEFEEQTTPDGNTYIYYQPIRAKTTWCFRNCHVPVKSDSSLTLGAIPSIGNSTARAEGDLMAIARLSFDTETTRTAINKNRAILVTTAIITVFLAMIAAYVIVRYVIVKPLRHLRDVSDAISRGDVSQRADIHTGDEFEGLAVAFNRMLRHLTTIQDELRQANVNLDGKVDELAQVNMRLYELNTLKSDFLATMSHELRTPLNSILGFSEVLGAIPALDEKQKRYVQNIQQSGRALLEMINDILDLAKIESGKMETRLTEFPIPQVIGAQCDMARPLTEKKNIDLDVVIPPDLPPLRQDQARVQQILNNLLSNAIKFTPEGGRIVVSVERDAEDFFVLRVTDTGVGIAAADQQTIFEKFRQGRTAMPGGDTMTREHSGTGLGLSIVKELCKLLGGEITVQSELGRGSTFTLRLPWRLEEQPRLDSALLEGLADFSRQRVEHARSEAPVG
ncbi:MAG: HAMP domain-containing protein [Pirellulales bacterium]|nr:HAMP domain-containing protein [Pirellulales bacterium]